MSYDPDERPDYRGRKHREQKIGIRLDVATLDKLDDLARVLSRRAHGARVSRMEAIRVALERGLREFQRDALKGQGLQEFQKEQGNDDRG